MVAIAGEGLAAELKGRVPTGVEVRAGHDALASIATDADVVVNGGVGFAALGVTLAALAAGRRLAVANRESLIAGGPSGPPVRAAPGPECLARASAQCALHHALRSLPVH